MSKNIIHWENVEGWHLSGSTFALSDVLHGTLMETADSIQATEIFDLLLWHRIQTACKIRSCRRNVFQSVNNAAHNLGWLWYFRRISFRQWSHFGLVISVHLAWCSVQNVRYIPTKVKSGARDFLFCCLNILIKVSRFQISAEKSVYLDKVSSWMTVQHHQVRDC